MAIRLAEQVPSWIIRADYALRERGQSRSDIKTGQDAWGVAHKLGFCKEAYDLSRDVYDAHIQTALERVFPNAVFKDAKRY